MIKINHHGAYYFHNAWLSKKDGLASGLSNPDEACRETIAHSILAAHSHKTKDNDFAITFDALGSHDGTYGEVLQGVVVEDIEQYPLPYVLTNCHRSLCTSATRDSQLHHFGLAASKKYGGIYVPPFIAILHQYMREMYAGCGKMLLCTDPYARYGPFGTIGITGSASSLVEQLLRLPYRMPSPKVIAVYLTGRPSPGVGPHDIAMALLKGLKKHTFLEGAILEFIGPGVASLSPGYRIAIDAMSVETPCISTVWQTDERILHWLSTHRRRHDFKELLPQDGAWYDSVVHVSLEKIVPMIALPFTPDNAWTIKEFLENAKDILRGVEDEAVKLLPPGAARPNLLQKLKKGALHTDQGIISGCVGSTYECIARVAGILRGKSIGNGSFNLSVYPASQPQLQELIRSGFATSLLEAGAALNMPFCGPCSGMTEIPGANDLSLRHTTSNAACHEGSCLSDGEMAFVALLDARSIAATALNKGKLTSAADMPEASTNTPVPYFFNGKIYKQRVYQGFGRAHPEVKLPSACTGKH